MKPFVPFLLCGVIIMRRPTWLIAAGLAAMLALAGCADDPAAPAGTASPAAQPPPAQAQAPQSAGQSLPPAAGAGDTGG
ncbi:hypothetical protein EYB31_31235, partial [Paenibacillus thalictri]